MGLIHEKGGCTRRVTIWIISSDLGSILCVFIATVVSRNHCPLGIARSCRWTLPSKARALFVSLSRLGRRVLSNSIDILGLLYPVAAHHRHPPTS